LRKSDIFYIEMTMFNKDALIKSRIEHDYGGEKGAFPAD
jgi:hypothetical protein